MYSPGHSTSLEGLHKWCWGDLESPLGTGSYLLPRVGRPCSPRISLHLNKPGTCTHRNVPMLQQGSAAWLPGKHQSTVPAASAQSGNAWLALSQLLVKEPYLLLKGVQTRDRSSTSTYYTSLKKSEEACQTPFRWSKGCFTSVFQYNICLFQVFEGRWMIWGMVRLPAHWEDKTGPREGGGWWRREGRGRGGRQDGDSPLTRW